MTKVVDRDAMRIRLDFNNMMAEYIGKEGIEPSEINGMAAQLKEAADGMAEGVERMKWRMLPYNQADVVADILKTAEKVRNQCDDFVVLGIGGSALGPIAVQQALNHLHYNDLPRERRGGPRLFVEDNVDPERMAALLDIIDLDKTMFNVITKSGSTSETMAQLLIVTSLLRERYGEDWGGHVIATTDTEKGNLI